MTRSVLQWHAKTVQRHLFPKYEDIVWPNLYFSHISLALFNRYSQSTALIQTDTPPFFAEWRKVFSPKNHCGLKASRTFEIALLLSGHCLFRPTLFVQALCCEAAGGCA